MRNYYDRLDAHRSMSDSELRERVELAEASFEPEYFDDVSTVLTDNRLHMHYRRLHLQYDAINTVLERGVPQQDSNAWSKRVVEFVSLKNELPD